MRPWVLLASPRSNNATNVCAQDIIGIILGAIAIIIEYFAHYTRLQHDLKPAAYADRHGRPSLSEIVLSKGNYVRPSCRISRHLSTNAQSMQQHISRHPHLFSYPLLALGIYFLCATPAFFAPYPEYRYAHALAAPAAKALVASIIAPIAIGGLCRLAYRYLSLELTSTAFRSRSRGCLGGSPVARA